MNGLKPIAGLAGVRAIVAGAVSAVTATSPADAAPITYTFERDHAIPRSEFGHNGLLFYIGGFLKAKGTAAFTFDADSCAVALEVQMNSSSIGNPSMEKITATQKLKVGQFPTMNFKRDRVRFADGKPAAVDDDLTLAGVTKPLTLDFSNSACGKHPRSKKEQCGGNLFGTLRHSDFGLKLGIPAIADDLKILAQAETIKDAP